MLPPAASVAPLTGTLLDIWRAGVAAVAADRLVQQAVTRNGNTLTVSGQPYDLTRLRQIAVIGAGKAGAGMLRGLRSALGDDVWHDKVTGWVNVPADCVAPDDRVMLHPARPAGVNEPTAAGVRGAQEILRIASSLGDDDLCLVLLSGGGSALLPAPCEGITLAEKLAVTRTLSRAGASIHELNTVRKQLSAIKGGGLARACQQGHTEVLIISDVIGNPLEIIASGPTVPNDSPPSAALEILHRFCPDTSEIPAAVWQVLEQKSSAPDSHPPFPATVRNHLIGENRVALMAAAQYAEQAGYEVRILGVDQMGTADDAGRELAQAVLAARQELAGTSRRVCLLSGGEPVVRLAPTTQPRRGGRNQQLVLSALCELWDVPLTNIALLSGGTDGEDGPTDAAGAWLDEAVRVQAQHSGLNPHDHLALQNAYPCLQSAGGLLITGPTHTNVMDLRVALVTGTAEGGLTSEPVADL